MSELVIAGIIGFVVVALAGIAAKLRHKPRKAPVKAWQPDPLRILDVWVARSESEFRSFPHVGPGTAALWYHSEPFCQQGAGFNYDAWPRRCSRSGLHPVDEVLEAARQQRQWFEDIILHEVGGHGVQGVGSDHNSPNPIMNDQHGTLVADDVDREELRAAIRSRFDAFRVHTGPPGAAP